MQARWRRETLPSDDSRQDVFVRWSLLGIAVLSSCPPAPLTPEAGPCMTAAPESVDFGEVEVGGDLASAFVRISNGTTRALPLTATRPEAPFSSDTVPDELSVNGSIYLGVRFLPADGLLHHGSRSLPGCSTSDSSSLGSAGASS